jgi:hypothetical protein
MSTTPSSYLNNIPAGSAEYPLAQQILSFITQAASTTNTAAAHRAKQELPSLFAQLVNNLIANGRFSASTILALVASATAAGGKTLTDVGVLGNVAVSGSAITINPGAY